MDNFNYKCNILPRNYITSPGFTGLVCAFLKNNDTTGKYSYVAITANFGYSTPGFNREKVMLESENIHYFKIQRINDTLLRYSLCNKSFEISLSYILFEFEI